MYDDKLLARLSQLANDKGLKNQEKERQESARKRVKGEKKKD